MVQANDLDSLLDALLALEREEQADAEDTYRSIEIQEALGWTYQKTIKLMHKLIREGFATSTSKKVHDIHGRLVTRGAYKIDRAKVASLKSSSKKRK